MESNSSIVVTNQRRPLQGIRIENPFTFKVLQVFTGFGLGCGVGIGVGKPINLGAVPMVGQVMSATRGATDAFSGVSRHVNGALRKMGANRVEVGIGCGVGFGHGIGIGLALKPGVVKKMQICLTEAMTNLMTKFGVDPNLSGAEGSFPNPMSLQSGMSSFNGPSVQNPLGSITQLTTKIPETSQGTQGYGYTSPYSSYGSSTSTSGQVAPPFGSRTEQVLNSFLQNPILNGDRTNLNEEAGRLRSENNLLQMVLKHQQAIEELVEENKKLRQILMEDLKISPSKIRSSHSTKNRTPCSDCFECRRKQRKK
ncbi:uncharacterized protein [Euphorbia lathyris]|uniref:uncharacterized protein n=1 Tax=Euphorbia lathyris TaxID=212925 RepID=UPI00331431EE